MHKRGLSIFLLLAGCVSTGTPVPHRSAPVTVAQASATPAPRPTATPASAPTATPAGNYLHAPSGSHHAVTGTVQLDAGYAVGQGVAKVSAGVLAFGNAAALVAGGGTNLIANNGGSLLSNNGGSVVSNNGGVLISEAGGALISEAGGAWKLLADDQVQLGTLLPAAGVVLEVRDVDTGKPVALGSDGAGHPAYNVVTNADGAFTVYLPDAQLNLRYLSAPLASGDGRLGSTLLAEPGSASVALDDDAAEVARYVVETLTGNGLFTWDAFLPEYAPGGMFADVVPRDRALALEPGYRKIVTALQALPIDRSQTARRREVAAHMADLVAARLKLSSLPIVKAHSSVPYDGPDEPSLPLLKRSLGLIREHVARVMQRELAAGHDLQAYFRSRPYVQGIADPPQIVKPEDFNAFIVRDVMTPYVNTSSPEDLTRLLTLFADPDVDFSNEQLGAMIAGVNGLMVACCELEYDESSPAFQAIITYLEGLKTSGP